MNIDSDTVLGAALRTAVSSPAEKRWYELTEDEKKTFVKAAGFLHGYVGPGFIKRFSAEQLGKALINHNASVFTPENAAAAGGAFINVVTTVCDDIY